jgi:hypothetical protein
MNAQNALALIERGDDKQRDAIGKSLAAIPPHLLHIIYAANVRFIALAPHERYDKYSPALRRFGCGVDDWPARPAGLTIVEERRIILQSCSSMTVIHEAMHGLDLALGGGVYYSSIDSQIAAAFKSATAFVTPYAASGTDEYFAEAGRAYIEANDCQSLWPRATRRRLRATDPTMFALIEAIFQPGKH